MINIDKLVISRKVPFFVIPGLTRNPVYIRYFQIFWTPVFTGVTAFYDFINIQC